MYKVPCCVSFGFIASAVQKQAMKKELVHVWINIFYAMNGDTKASLLSFT